MLLVNTDYITGKDFEMLGIVKGSTTQIKNLTVMQGIKKLVGGDSTKFNDMMNNARSLATKRMTEDAEVLGADAVVGIRYATSPVMPGTSEVVAYGTAVKFI